MSVVLPGVAVAGEVDLVEHLPGADQPERQHGEERRLQHRQRDREERCAARPRRPSSRPRRSRRRCSAAPRGTAA